jgi:GlpG protein
MRRAGNIPLEVEAKRFIDYLYTQGIRAMAEPTRLGTWDIWINEESQIEQSKIELHFYMLNPGESCYMAAPEQAKTLVKEARNKRKKVAEKIVSPRRSWGLGRAAGKMPVTLTLIAISLLVALLTRFGKDLDPVRPYLFITKLTPGWLGGWTFTPGLEEIRHGQIWRLVTPIFIHMDFFHVAFNMYWLWIFGSMIESRRGSLRFLALVLVSAVASNLAQYAYRGPEMIFFGHEATGGPFFGGMSGVGYALFGFCWLRTILVRTEAPFVDGRIAFLFLVWFFICVFGDVGPVANVAHAVGLLVGAVAGAAPKLLRR